MGNAKILEEVEFEKEENIRNVVFEEESVNDIGQVLVPITIQETTPVIGDNVQTIVPDIVLEQDYDEILRDRSQGLEIIGYSDSDFARCQDNKPSTYGYIYMLARGAISWKSGIPEFPVDDPDMSIPPNKHHQLFLIKTMEVQAQFATSTVITIGSSWFGFTSTKSALMKVMRGVCLDDHLHEYCFFLGLFLVSYLDLVPSIEDGDGGYVAHIQLGAPLAQVPLSNPEESNILQFSFHPMDMDIHGWIENQQVKASCLILIRVLWCGSYDMDILIGFAPSLS
ncbi:hypothetical protein CR513_51850, partial [Mucuna pruriens]